ncbi:hypothetical protein [Chromohalobacter nigrandesensis]|uniref:hypothetical protein n=1 Tax=Chromohalobacter nigrandesensis TaxID=119863 RepID=UPI001FF2C26F|nr:hypothetical protein [Chromohalobacter nigrandesensis]MCK0743939.1 hypothetical protein [Chromohalobacter nigrandesensis]
MILERVSLSTWSTTRLPHSPSDLVVMDWQGETLLFSSHRIGGRLRLMPTTGPRESLWARQSDLRGVVVSQARRYGW